MESREEARFEVDQEVTVTLLGEVETALRGKVVNLSGKGVCLLSGQELPSGSALKIELGDTLVLGEVAYCRRQENVYYAGIELNQALYHTQHLAALAQRLLGREVLPAHLRQGGDAAIKRHNEHGQEADEENDRQTVGHVPTA
jgi:hypothetical protein